MKQTISLWILGLFLLSTQLMAAEQTIITATVDGEPGRKLELILMLDKKKDIKKFRIIDSTNGKVVENTTYSTAGAATGIVLLEAQGREVVKLVSHNFSAHQGGDVILDYLYNGITKSRGNVEFDLGRRGDKWEVTVNGRKVTRMKYIKNRKVLVGDIGIKRIDFN